MSYYKNQNNPTSFLLQPATRSAETIACSRAEVSPQRPLVDSICQSTTFVQNELSDRVTCTYSRVTNPTVEALEQVLGRLEQALPSVCFSSGLAAETSLFLALLKSGDHVILSAAIYGGTVRLIRQIFSGLGVTASFVDATDTQNVADAIQSNTRLVFIETPANPTLCLNDIQSIASVTRKAGIPLAVDNTFLTPVLQQPLELGADISVYSTTKHIEGHSSALGGAITSRDQQIIDRLRWIRKSTGTIQTPQNAWLTLRGIKTLPLRIREHSRHAAVVANELAADSRIKSVNYPGLDNFPQADLASQQHLGGHGGVISFELHGGYDATCRFLRSVRLCSLVEHIGSVETLLTHPASMTHADVPREQLEAVGLTPGLVRLSVGLEDPQDILADLFSAIDVAVADVDRDAVTESAKGGGACVLAV